MAKKIFKKTLNILSIVLLVILVLIVLVNLYMMIAQKVTGKSNPTLFGFTYALVKTNSMAGDEADSFEGNDMVFTMARGEYAENDIVMIQYPGYSVTHRIIEDLGDGTYVTKGDANNAADLETVSKDNIVGRVFLTIPDVGWVLAWFSTSTGRFVLIMALALVILLPMVFEKRNSTPEGQEAQDADGQSKEQNAPESKDE